MDFGMWRRVLLVLFFVVNGLCASKNNEEVFRKLCLIAGNVSALMKKENSEAKSTLHEALYGGNELARFNDEGTFTGYCGLSMHSRSQYCSHIQGGRPHLFGSDKPGCFADSLVGTFLCLCTKGNNEEKDLCGLKNLDGVGSWISWRGDDHEQILFKTVWGGVKQKCFKNNTADLETLKNALEEIRGTAQQKSSGYVTLGGTSTNGHCGGANPGDACVTYKGSGNTPDIPWADKILEGIQKIKEARTQSKTRSNSVQTDHHQQDTDGSSDEASEGEAEDHEEEGDEESAENQDPQNPSKPSRPRRKRRSTIEPTKQHAESLKAILHDDGSFLPQPFWLLSAVVI